jgi:Rad52/22 family double-strand break repair protein
MDTRNWEQVLDGLRVQFSVDVVAWKPQTISRERKRCLAVPYVDTQPYQERLDQICPEWQDDYVIWFSDPQEALGRAGEKRVISGKVFVKCRLTIAERTRSDVGECELTDENALTSAKAQAFKRACAAFGLGRYLYDLPKPWVDYDAERGITEVELKKLEGLLRRYAGTQSVSAERGGPASEIEGQSPAMRAERVEYAARSVAAPLRTEANGHVDQPAGDTNGDARHAAAGSARPEGMSQPGREIRRPSSVSERAPGLGAGGDAGQAASGRHPNENRPPRSGDSELPVNPGLVNERDQPARVTDARPDAVRRFEAGQLETEQPQAAVQTPRPVVLEPAGNEITLPGDGERAPGASNEARPSDEGKPTDEASVRKPASSPSAGEERRESPRSPARKKVTEGTSAGKATMPGGTQPGDGAPPAPTIGSAAVSAAGAESEGPVLCPTHKVPLQLLITREGKALLLHKIEGEGYCNGQEVRQVARG